MRLPLGAAVARVRAQALAQFLGRIARLCSRTARRSQIGDIRGESTDAKHKDEIDVDSWSWGASNPAAVVMATVAEPTATRMNAATIHPKSNGGTDIVSA